MKLELKLKQDPLPTHGFEHVFTHELRHAVRDRRAAARHLDPAQGEIPTDATPADALRYELVGLALSGGGIRSAATNLGFLQALSKGGQLARCDYLSTVSGGGYIGCGLTSLLSNPAATVDGASFPFSFNGRVERPEVRRLRAYGNYLAPRHGLLASGTWRMISAYLLGLSVNLLMVFLVVGAVATVGIWLCAEYVRLLRLPALIPLFDRLSVPWDPDGKRSEFWLLMVPALVGVAAWALVGATYMVGSLYGAGRHRGFGKEYRTALGKVAAWLLRASAVVVVFAMTSRLFHFMSPRDPQDYLGVPPNSHSTVVRLLQAIYAFVTVGSGLPLLRSKAILDRVRQALAPHLLTLAAGAFAVNFVLGVTFVAWRFKDDGAALVAAAAIATAVGAVVDQNRVSMFYFYRDRLSEAFLFQNPAGASIVSHVDDLRSTDDLRLNAVLDPGTDPTREREGGAIPAAARASPAPARATYYPLINATVNVPGSRAPKLQGRPADYFLFSPAFCGSEVTGYVETSAYEGGRVTLGDAMAVSGAAANPQLGYKSNRLLAFVLAVFNARLGLWIENPGYYPRFGPRKYRVRFWPWYLLLELVSKADEKRAYVNVSDGGHVDNLGLYELLRRRCRTIIVSDVSSDQDHGYVDLAGVIRRARIDMGIQVEIDCSKLEPDPATGLAPTHVVEGTISYPEGDKDDPARLYLTKTTVTAKDPVDVKERRRSTKTFPNETTLDQFFDEAQFEEYRELGYRAGKEMCEVIANRGKTMEAKAADSDA